MVTQRVVGARPRPAVIGHRLAVAAAVLFGTFTMGLGTTWDISWHATVGRDTFWIPPHLVIYGGIILASMALVNAWVREVSGPRLPGDDEGVRVGPWRVAGGIALSTVGGVWFLASAPFDDLWHRLFGLDVTLWSPPHLSLMAAAWTMVLGALMLILRERQRLDLVAPDRGATQRTLELGLLVLGLGFLIQPASLALVPAIRYSYLTPGPLGPWLLPLLIAAVIPALAFAAPAVLRMPFGVTVPVVVQLALRPIGAAFAALGYASSS